MHCIKKRGIHRHVRTMGRGGALFLLAATVVLLPVRFATAAIAFEDVSAAAGIEIRNESYGASWGDLNGDGYPDVFVSNHRQQPNIFLNQANGTFYRIGPDVLTWRNRAGADTHGGTWADFDNDGDQDLLVSTGTGNLSQLLVNENQRLVDRTIARGLDITNVGGRLPVWLDFNRDRLPDFVMTQYGGIAKLFRQNAGGTFTEVTSNAKLVCTRFHYGHLYDVNDDDRLELLCPSEAKFPQKIYETASMPWRKLFDAASPNSLFPITQKVVDSIVGDFDNDGRLDVFMLSGVQLRPASVVAGDANHFEAQLTGGTKGFKFVSDGAVTLNPAWNKSDSDTTVEFKRIQVGATGWSPTTIPFTLDPANTNVHGFPQPPTDQAQLPLMQVGFNPSTKLWTVVIQTKLTTTSPNVFSEAYVQVDTAQPYSKLAASGLWPSDKAARPTLLMNRVGGYVDATEAAGLAAPVQCVSVTTADFDNDGDLDLYLACRTGASNIANVLYENLGNGTFQAVANAGGAAGPVGIAVASGAGTADSVVSADYDLDGNVDLFVTNGFNLRPLGYGGPNKLFRNRGNGNNWVQLDLVGTQSDRDAVGAKVYAMAAGKTQLRVQDGSYHRWSQDLRRAHFGLAGSATVDLRVEWPSGNVQTFNGVAANRLYRVTEGSGIAVVTPGNAPAYPCGAPPLDGATDVGVFVWRDCPSGEWRLKTVSARARIVYSGTVASTVNYLSVTPQGLEADDVVNGTTDPKRIAFSLVTTGTGTDGFNFKPQDGKSACLKLDAPAGVTVYYGPMRKPVAQPFDVDTQASCNVP
ncbi:MAG TPA: CRTAC1 family protein [Steroidobacteraceae bacterium]|nr:CRTAC1 family protein [Steroidobacteraceae bacterium]